MFRYMPHDDYNSINILAQKDLFIQLFEENDGCIHFTYKVSLYFGSERIFEEADFELCINLVVACTDDDLDFPGINLNYLESIY